MKVKKLVGSPSGPIEKLKYPRRYVSFASNSYTEYREPDGRITVQKHRGGSRLATQQNGYGDTAATGYQS